MEEVSGGKQFIKSEKVLQEIGVKPGDRIADMGCGALGYFTFAAAKVVGKNGLIYAIDVRQIVLEGIRNRARIDGLTNIETIWANLEIIKSTGIADVSVDLSFLFNVLFQNKKREEILTEAIRILRPGGRLAVIDWLGEKNPFGPQVDALVNKQGILQFCKKFSLTLEKEFNPSSYHFGLLFIKNK
ncbi:MAG: methyltransferase domain-containing protein [Patescibacteria group bacterium]|jgi:ubiquinone/menaquinone biosynthesis C-methylase UbiE